ncbi:imm11 family protein [Rossellomorea aquimaris]|uniref:Maleate cis-trans isomerase n=1 Tax=Rossellomorea aquimaris TaxID=189382 RepID=A0A5D4U7E4_9BACI|nr:DUF1629 domain-containing protein [Rossellomorea aquimaris]TYS76508.1 maleate cis-trans isomerase [Rossellomorea aquimaris]TYS83098.1 maleate cis-trans isomerase [Rossellomorea aquimaris]
MKYYKIMMDDSNVKDAVVHCEDSFGFDYSFNNGKFINDWNDRITFYFNPTEGDSLTDYLANNFGWLIFSRKLKNLLNEIGVVGMQFLPVNVVNKLDSDEKWDYFAVNVHNVVDALHLDGSDYSVLNVGDEKIYTIRKYALRRESIKNQHIFRSLGYEIPIFTSEKVKSIIDNNFITGCDFLEVKVM